MTGSGAPLPALHRGILPFLVFLLFAGLFFAGTKVFPANVADIYNEQVLSLFPKYVPFAGFAFGFLSLLGMYILYALRGLFGLKGSRLAMPLLLFLGYAPWAAFGYQLAFREPRYAMIAKAIIEFAGKPMLLAGGVVIKRRRAA